MGSDCSRAPTYNTEVFSNTIPGFPTLGNGQAAISNSEGVAEIKASGWLNGNRIRELLWSSPHPGSANSQGRKPWATIRKHLRCRESRSRKVKIMKRQLMQLITGVVIVSMIAGCTVGPKYVR